MADNVAITAGTGTTIATDDVSTVHYQRVKLVDGTLDATTAIAAGGGVEAGALRVTLASDSTGVVSVDDNGGALTVDNGGTFAVQIDSGAVTSLALLDDAVFADDAAFTIGTSKVSMSGAAVVAHGAAPDAADAGDAAALLVNRNRVLFTIGGHPNIQSSEYLLTGAVTDDNILPAIGAGTIYVITQITVTCSAANTVNTTVRIGFGTANVPTQGASAADAVAKVILSHPGIAPGSGIVKGNGGAIVGIGGDGEELRITNSAPTGGSLVVQVDWYSIAS